MVDRNRGISTVMDVCLALLIISASVLMIGMYLADSDDSIEGDRGDQALQTLSGSTISFTYNLDAPNEDGHAATDSDNYELPENFEPENVEELYNVTTYGSAADLLGEAALTNLYINGNEVFAYGHDVEQSVDAAIQDRLVGSEGNVYAIATWEIHDGSQINGTASTGERPPASADVSSATMEVSTNAQPIDNEKLAREYDSASIGGGLDEYEAVGLLIAESVVEAYFPSRETQYTLESTLSEQPATLYNYRQMADMTGVDVEDAITGDKPNATEANQKLIGDPQQDGLANQIAEDLRNSATSDRLDDAEDIAELEKVFENLVTPGTIVITVQTWD